MLIDPETKRATDAFLRQVRTRFDVTGALLFGSRARGDHRSDSDADVAVFLGGEPQRFVDTKLALADIAFEILLETDVHIQPLPIWDRQWSDPRSAPNPRLFENIRREGIRL